MRLFSCAVGLLSSSLLSLAEAALPPAWTNRTVYQLLTDRFAAVPAPKSCSNYGGYCGGNFRGVIAHLDYIQGLGFDAVWISPVVDNAAGGYHGYWQRNMEMINSNFGTAADLKALSDALHARGMWLMVDIVANHASSDADVSQNVPFSSAADYHDCNGCPSGCNVNDYTNLPQMEHCRLAGLRDFNNSDENGQNAKILYNWISALVTNYSIDGLRIDTLPYVHPAFWKKFEAAAGVYAVGEVDNGDINFVSQFQAPKGSNAALSGVLSYPLFYTLRNVFRDKQSMKQLGDAWRAATAAYSNLNYLGVYTDNHDNPRFMNTQKDKSLYRAAIAWSLLSDGIPIVYYGSEWLYAGGNDPGCREPLWNAGISYNATAAPLGPLMTTLNAYRRAARMSESLQTERWSDDSLYAFSKGPTGNMIVFTNVGATGATQKRDITSLPSDWKEGTVACNILKCGDASRECVTVTGGKFTVSLSGVDAVAVYDAAIAC